MGNWTSLPKVLTVIDQIQAAKNMTQKDKKLHTRKKHKWDVALQRILVTLHAKHNPTHRYRRCFERRFNRLFYV